MSEQSYAACASEKQLVIVEGAGHGFSFLKDEALYKAAVEAFFNKHE